MKIKTKRGVLLYHTRSKLQRKFKNCMTNFLQKIEYNIPLLLAFVDYHKASDSVETWAFLTALEKARIDSRYSALIKDVYDEATFHIKIDEDEITEKLDKGVDRVI